MHLMVLKWGKSRGKVPLHTISVHFRDGSQRLLIATEHQLEGINLNIWKAQYEAVERGRRRTSGSFQ